MRNRTPFATKLLVVALATTLAGLAIAAARPANEYGFFDPLIDVRG